MNPKDIFIENANVCQTTLRRYYKDGQYTPYECSICQLQPFWQGKELTLILDHINGINTDDRLENLRWVCPNCNQQLGTTNGGNSRKYAKNYCLDCGAEIHHLAQRCKKCHLQYRKTTSGSTIPISREELKDLIRNKPFTQIGQQFGITDNAIRKWCDNYNLPRKSLEIKKYTNEEWDLI